jgi:hypothetical protein
MERTIIESPFQAAIYRVKPRILSRLGEGKLFHFAPGTVYPPAARAPAIYLVMITSGSTPHSRSTTAALFLPTQLSAVS